MTTLIDSDQKERETELPPTQSLAPASRPYLWLGIGAVLLVFSNGILSVVPLATWLAPLFLIRYLRTQPLKRGLLIFAPVHLIAWVIMLYGILPDLGVGGNAFGAFYGLVLLLPFLADRIMAPRLDGFRSTLIFPLALVTVEYLLSIWDFTGSWFSLAYTQRDNLPLIQLVSVTGLWGVTFLMAWFASVANWAWEHDFSLVKVRRGLFLYAAVFAGVFLFGGAYIAFTPADSDTIRVASVTRSFDVDDEADLCDGDVPCLERLFDRTLIEFLDTSEQAIAGGAQVILWQENGVAVYAADEAAFIEQARDFAVREDIHLVMGMKMVADEDPNDENKAVFITPSGEVSEYLKNRRSPGDEHVKGDGNILIEESEHGTLATLICRDFDYPSFVRQAGSAGVDIMLIPSHDWEAVDPFHARMANFRAIENGYSMISANYHGTSTAVDFHGNTLAIKNNFETADQVMFADLPTQGVRTVYSVIGDLFAWAGIVMLFALVWLSRRSSVKDLRPQPEQPRS